MAVIKIIPKKKKCKKAKWLSEEALQIAVKRREAKDKEGHYIMIKESLYYKKRILHVLLITYIHPIHTQQDKMVL